jgi:hypothetical protein
MYKDHKGSVYIYGDQTGGQKKSSNTEGTDWDLVKEVLGKVFHCVFRVPNSNPRERARVNAVNSRVCSLEGIINFYVDLSCVNVIKSFEGVMVKPGSAGEILKPAIDMLTHLTDAIGYYIAAEYPIRERRTIITHS